MVWRVKDADSYDGPDGVPVTMRVGDLLEDGDPRAVGREQFLQPAEEAAQESAPSRAATTAVETATAAPGERRTRGKTTSR